ncbi:TPA: hypothetical protein N5O03_000202 [Enterobacter hormaechei subsp. xiangfangensis]|nr:hypothetical protein [Enterobacter hormaechei subsp. xiangfangensis]HCM9384166.1 hypothetical protein [Enterobacter hormaechei subsp. xiangfangensis]HCM9694243.1 hypothetical protein [Enterobacter hormaechei subsp. xiangfangensis]
MKLNYEELEAKCAALAAEFAGIKAAIDATIRWQQSTDPENVESVRMIVDVKTPATEVILAEVRAQGVDMLLDVYRSRWISPHVEDADRFAAQLRKGVQS